MNVSHVATAAVLSLFAVILSGCNGASTSANNPPSNANLEGTWEIVSTSTTNPGVSTVIDVILSLTTMPRVKRFEGQFSCGRL